ncbi:MAG: oligosaccharide flippase family protein [Candidatus Freyarchaeota archaeon]|nr:oligosaccharide flippase family protein [Candidatus Jordarchaeia archaeon]MBS7270232.1 oligosaccharide flippase family protein [Candidatus Jordarchaeia archaeon]MBS7280969.1 oligosaccharide flippase family protein [Candidatus Jordarchaeia archaeon]
MSEDQARVFSGTLYNYVTLFLIVILTAINTIIIANAIGAQLYGGYSVGKIIIDLLTGLCSLGLSAGLVRFIPDFLARQKFSSVNSAISTSSIVIFSASALFTVIFFFASPYIATNIFSNYWLTPILQIMSLTFPLIVVNAVTDWILNGFQRFGLSMLIRMVFTSIYLLFVVIFLGLGFSIEGVIYAFILGYAVSGVVGVIFVLRVSRKVIKSEEKFKIFDFCLFKDMFNFGKWAYGISFVELGFQRFNELVIGVILLEVALAVYRISQTFSSILGYVGLALATTLNPYFSELTSISREEKAVSMMKRSTSYSLIISLLIAAPIIVFAYQILETFFTQQYFSGADPLKVLIIGYVIANISKPVGSYFFAKKKLWINFSIQTISLLTVVASSYLLIPIFAMNGLNQYGGMIGAAIGFTLGWIVNLILFAYFTRRYFKINILEKNSAIWAITFILGITVLALLTKINFELSILGLVIFEAALALKYKRELLNLAKTAEAYLLPLQKSREKIGQNH